MWERFSLATATCETHGPQVTPNALQHLPGCTGYLGVGARHGPAKSPPNVKCHIQQGWLDPNLRSICTRILLRAEGEDSWAAGRPRGRVLANESMSQGSNRKQDHSEQDCKPSVHAPLPHPTSLTIMG